MPKLSKLPDRTVLAVTGEDRAAFLQGLVSNDVTAAVPGRAVWAALLTPQGKYLADFFVLADGDRLLLDCEADRAGIVADRLLRFRLRAKAAIEPAGLEVYAAWQDEGAAAVAPPENAIVAADPRLPEAGARILAAAPLDADATPAEYDRHRLGLGLPDGSRDMEVEKSVLLEGGFDELGGISWSKGCYMGQELTARTRYRGLLKRRLVPVRGASLPAPGAALVLEDGREAGTMRSSSGDRGLALLRIELFSAPLRGSDGQAVEVHVPGWMTLPAAVPA